MKGSDFPQVFLAGPEQDRSVTEKAMGSRHWHATGIGFGMRGATNLEVIEKFEGLSSRRIAENC